MFVVQGLSERTVQELGTRHPRQEVRRSCQRADFTASPLNYVIWDLSLERNKVLVMLVLVVRFLRGPK